MRIETQPRLGLRLGACVLAACTASSTTPQGNASDAGAMHAVDATLADGAGTNHGTDGASEDAGPTDAAPSCALPANPSSGALSISVAGQTRTYVLVLPSGYDGAKAWPVFFAWHGTGSSGAEFLGTTYGGITQGVAGRMLIVAPDGLQSDAGQTTWRLSEDDGVFFDALLAALRASYCIDPGRVFSTGHSIGGFFTNYLGCTRGDKLRGIAPISGGGPFLQSCVGKPAVLIGHNPNECAETGPGCPWSVPWPTTGWPTTLFWTSRNGCEDPSPMPTAPLPGTPPCKRYTQCDALAPVELCLYDYSTVYAGPHAWPEPWLAGTITDYFLGLP